MLDKLILTKTNTGFQVDTHSDTKTEHIFQTDNINQLLGYVAAKLETMKV